MKTTYLILALAVLSLLAACNIEVTVNPSGEDAYEDMYDDMYGMGWGPMGGHMGGYMGGNMGGMMVTSEEDFLVEMIPHHQEAIDTSRVIAARTDNEELRDLSNRIITAQTSEIGMMQGWLDEYYNGGEESTYVEMMPNLESREGEEQDVAYLQGMIRHHMMAVMMARQVLQLDPRDEVADFAKNVISVQTSEIREMQDLLRKY